MTLAMSGRLKLSLDGIPSKRPLDVAIEGITLNLPEMMEAGTLTIEQGTDRAILILEQVTLTLSLDVEEVLSRAGVAIMDGIEQERL